MKNNKELKEFSSEISKNQLIEINGGMDPTIYIIPTLIYWEMILEEKLAKWLKSQL